MGLSDLVLGSGEVVVILSDSTIGIAPVNKAVNFGVVQLVNQLSDKTTVGQSVWFEIDKAVGFMIISGQTFYKVNEQYITATEPYIP